MKRRSSKFVKKTATRICLNSIDGQDLYNKVEFKKEGLELHFLKTGQIDYLQIGKGEFVPNLSIIDVLMHCGKEQTLKLLDQYTLI